MTDYARGLYMPLIIALTRCSGEQTLDKEQGLPNQYTNKPDSLTPAGALVACRGLNVPSHNTTFELRLTLNG